MDLQRNRSQKENNHFVRLFVGWIFSPNKNRKGKVYSNSKNVKNYFTDLVNYYKDDVSNDSVFLNTFNEAEWEVTIDNESPRQVMFMILNHFYFYRQTVTIAACSLF